jgi:putative ABC transport system substrate-binding protein
MKRRHFLGATLALPAAAPFSAWAQGVKRVGFLVTGDPEPTWSLFRKGMVEVGYGEGRSVAYDYRSIAAPGLKLDEAAAELAHFKVDVIVAILTPAVAAARRATSTFPIAWLGADLQGTGIGCLSRPEGNVTGVLSPSSTLAGKGLQLFHEIRPATRLFGLLLNPGDPFHVPLRRDVETVAQAEEIDLAVELPKSRDGIGASLDALIRRGVAGVMVQPSVGLDIAARLALGITLPATFLARTDEVIE